MAKKQVYIHFSLFTAVIHFSFILLYVACIFLIFLSKTLRFYAAIFFCLIWIQQKMFDGCSLTRLESYFLKKGGKKCDGDIFFCNRLAHGLFKEKFRVPPNQLRLLVQRVILFFCIISGFIIILHFC